MRSPHDRRSDLARRDHDRAIGCSAPHFDSINREVGDILAFSHGRIGKKISDDHDSLPSKSGHNEVVIKMIV
jgi:hypothetical protein